MQGLGSPSVCALQELSLMEGPQSVKEKGICEHLVQGQSQNTMLPLEEQPTRIRVERLPEGWYLHEELIRFLTRGKHLLWLW